jgi:FtsH-binding integral membrane protein
MSPTDRSSYLRIALLVFGVLFIFGVYPMFVLWPSGWNWGHGHSHYQLMIVGIYATLGVFLLLASRNPAAHRSLIWFTVWSSVVHGAIMAVQAISDEAERGHLIGDIPALFLVAIVLGLLMPRSSDRPAGTR